MGAQLLARQKPALRQRGINAGAGMALGENEAISGRPFGLRRIKPHHLATFGNDGNTITVTTDAPATILYGQAEPVGEPVVSYGPFVMNTREEIVRAIEDYNAGLFGKPPVIR